MEKEGGGKLRQKQGRTWGWWEKTVCMNVIAENDEEKE